MYLSEFLVDVDVRYQDPFYEDSSELARNAAFCIVDLIKRHFDVLDFLELIYTESCNFEYSQGVNFGRHENDSPF